MTEKREEPFFQEPLLDDNDPETATVEVKVSDTPVIQKVERRGPDGRLQRWWTASMPSRESLAENRFLRPVAHRVLVPELWRFTRRSVPAGVALGLFIGIFLMIPGLQIAGAALLALPFRANVPIAAAMTFLSNPATTPFILAASIYVGNILLGRHADVGRVVQLIESHASLREWAGWMFSEAAPALLAGLFVISAVAAIIGYFLALWMWRWRVGGKWNARKKRSGEG